MVVVVVHSGAVHIVKVNLLLTLHLKLRLAYVIEILVLYELLRGPAVNRVENQHLANKLGEVWGNAGDFLESILLLNLTSEALAVVDGVLVL